MLPLLNLDTIQAATRISSGRAKQLMEGCVWCLLTCKHSNGITLGVVADGKPDAYSVCWNDSEIDVAALNRTYDEKRGIEDGAEAIALLLVTSRTDYNAVQRTILGTGIDYWLGYQENLNNPFKSASRIEISGLLSENSTNTVKRRVASKLEQTKPTDHTFPVYVIVVEFSQPYAQVVLKK